jgi:cAMP-dependent protein kinase regulator
MGCGQSKNDDIDFGELDIARSEKQMKEGSEKPSYLSHLNSPMESLAKQARPVMHNFIQGTPKLSDHFQATTAVVMGNNPTARGAHHLKNVFAPPLEDPGSFTAPVFPKAVQEKQFIREALKSNFVFAALSERELRTIIDAFEALDFKADERLIVQGDVGDFFYVLRRGTVRFEVNDTVVGHAGEGKSFGELSLLYTSPRAASVIAESKGTLYRVDQKTFRYIMQSQTLQTENDKKDLLKGVKFFSPLDPTDINKLVHTMVPRVFEAGEYIVRKGEEGDTFYVIQEGKVRVTDITMGSTKYEDQVLGPGDYFGERALVHKEPRSANCIGKTKGIALSIDKDTFEKVVGNIALLTIKAEDTRKLVSEMVSPNVTSCCARGLFDLLHFFSPKKHFLPLLSSYPGCWNRFSRLSALSK